MEERHQDGGRHWHIFVEWEKSISLRVRDQWDVTGVHPNIAVATNGILHDMRLWRYLCKSGEPWGPWTGPTEVIGKQHTIIALY